MTYPTQAQMKVALQAWAQRELGLTVIFARQAKARPQVPYASINVIASGGRIGSIDEMRIDGTNFTMEGNRRMMVSLNVYGDEANERLTTLIASLDRPDVIEELELVGLAHVGENGPNDLTELEDTKYLERAQVDLNFTYAIQSDAQVEYIDEVELESELYSLDDEPSDLILTDTITIETT